MLRRAPSLPIFELSRAAQFDLGSRRTTPTAPVAAAMVSEDSADAVNTPCAQS